MKKLLISCILALVATASYAQSASEISAAKNMARSYGYSEAEINAVLNKNDMSGTDGRNNRSPYSQKSGNDGIIPNQALPGGFDYLGNQIPITVEPLDSLAEEAGIFGHDFFISKGLSLIPSVTAPVPESYVLGPGDDVTVSVWGASSASFDLTVGSDGSIVVPSVGPVFVSGHKLSDAQKLLFSRLAEYYPGLNDKTSSLQVTVGRIRGVSVYVLGEVKTPGVYTLPSLCNIPTAVYLAGGVNPTGSVRHINLFRGGKKVGTFDVYAFIFNGVFNPQMKLQDGDIISVEPAGAIVEVTGEMHREMKFEMTDDETVSSLIQYAGGFTSQARRDVVHVDRMSSVGGTAFDVPSALFKSFKFQDGDQMSVRKGDDIYKNRVSIEGNVINEGYYAISDNLRTVRDLIAAAGGLKEGTFMRRAYIRRFNDKRLPVEVSFNLQEVIDGKSDINLVRDDEVKIYSNYQVSDTSMVVVIFGEINEDGEYPFREGMTIGDLLLLAGGTKDGADLSKVEVAVRGRENEPYIQTLNLIADSSAYSTELHPYDKVYVKSMEHYRDLKSIKVTGEVRYPGYYAVEKNTVRLSDIISRAEGVTTDAYVPGARLKRKMLENDVENAEFIQKVAEQNRFKTDSLNLDLVSVNVPADSLSTLKSHKVGDYYSIAIDLQAALDNPGSDMDIILRDGDILDIPQMNNTVKISGGVYLPNVVAFNPEFGWRDYVNLAGGLTKDARRSKIYAVYQDGSSAVKGSSKFHMEPGMELVIPRVEKSDNRKLSPGEWAAMASAVTSVTSIVVMLINQLKR